jgi:hypothetical protein
MIYGRDGMGIIGMITAPFLLSFSFVEGRTRCSWLALYTCSLETTFGWALSLFFLVWDFFWQGIWVLIDVMKQDMYSGWSDMI